jgi:hypothetical protein
VQQHRIFRQPDHPEFLWYAVGFAHLALCAVPLRTSRSRCWHQVALQLFSEFGEDGLQLQDRRRPEIKALLEGLLSLTDRLQAA